MPHFKKWPPALSMKAGTTSREDEVRLRITSCTSVVAMRPGGGPTIEPFAAVQPWGVGPGLDAPLQTYTTPARMLRCSVNTAFIQSITARTQVRGTGRGGL